MHVLVDQYREKYGTDLRVHWFDAEEERDAGRMKEALGSGSLFSAKSMVVVERLCGLDIVFESMRDAVRQSVGRKDIFVILWEAGSTHETRRRAEVCEKSADHVQKFDPLKGPALARWVDKEAAARGVELTDAVRSHIAAEGSDLWRVVNVIEKSALVAPSEYADGRAPSSNVFLLGDTFFTSPAEAAHHLFSLLAVGEKEHGLFAYLINYTRTLLLIRASAAGGRPMPAEVKPFVIQKGLALVRRMPPGMLTGRLRQFYEEDWKIKNGLSTPRESLFSMLFSKN